MAVLSMCRRRAGGGGPSTRRVLRALVLLLALSGCGAGDATPGAADIPPAAPSAPTPSPGQLAGLLQGQIHQYERLYYAHRPADAQSTDWGSLDAALAPMVAESSAFAAYYRWIRAEYRRNGSEAYRHPAVLRAEIARYLDAPPPAGVPLGSTATLAEWALEVVTVERLGAGPLVWSQAHPPLPPTGSWLRIRISMRNTGPYSVYVFPSSFELRDGLGWAYTAPQSPATAAYSAYAGASPLAELVRSGAAGEYWLIFDIPPDAAGLQLVFREGGGAVLDLSR